MRSNHGERERDEDESGHLGVREHGDAVQRRWLQARAFRHFDRREGPDGGRRPGRADRRLRVPLPAGALAREPRRGARRARRTRHLLHRERAAPGRALRQGRPLLTRRRDPRGGAAADAGGDRPGRLDRSPHDHLARDRGVQLPVPDALCGVVVALRRWRRSGGELCARAGRDDLPRAQELRAGDEDPDAQHRDDAAT